MTRHTDGGLLLDIINGGLLAVLVLETTFPSLDLSAYASEFGGHLVSSDRPANSRS